MARCGCSGASCSCLIVGEGGVTVVGAGSINNPYRITSDIDVGVADTSTINMTKSGDGSPANPFLFQADATIDLNALTDVDTTGATTGQVLAKQADGSYKFVPATTAAVGALSIGDGLQGDASSGNKLRILLAPSSGLSVGPAGLLMVGGGVWSTYVPVFSASTTNPAIGNGGIEGYYSQVGKTVNFSIEFTYGSTTSRGVGAYSFTLPVPPATNRRQMVTAHVARYGVADYVCDASIAAGRLDRVHLATSTAAQALSHSVPATMPTNSVIAISGSYEAA